jgi:hypothetical protein
LSSSSSSNRSIPITVTVNSPSIIPPTTSTPLNPFLYCSKFNLSTL